MKFRYMPVLVAVLALILLILKPAMAAGSNGLQDSSTPPLGYIPTVPEAQYGNTEALLIEDLFPWGRASVEGAFTEFGVTYDLVRSWELAAVDLSDYKFIVYPSDQPTWFYQNIEANIGKIETFVSSGGLLIAHVTDRGWNNGNWDDLHILPGNVTHVFGPYDDLRIADTLHPIIKGTPPGTVDIYALNPNYFDGWGCSTHGYLDSLTPNTSVVVDIQSGGDTGAPTYICYDYGLGKVLATMQTVEWGYGTDGTNGYSWPGPRPELMRNEIRFARAFPFRVDIDIKPGSFPNSINTNSKGVIPVAILTTLDFDATTVDPEMLVFADASLLRWAIEDVDYDGDMDMILHFATQEVKIGCEETEARLDGQTFDGKMFFGTDSVRPICKGG